MKVLYILGHDAFIIITNDKTINNVHGVETHSGRQWNIRLERLNEQKWRKPLMSGWGYEVLFMNEELLLKSWMETDM